MDPNDGMVRADVDAAIQAADTYKAARAAVPPGRRYLIGVCAAPAGPRGRPPDVAPVEPDVAAAVWCHGVAADAMERVRNRGYDGSMRLLRDMAAAGYDVDAPGGVICIRYETPGVVCAFSRFGRMFLPVSASLI